MIMVYDEFWPVQGAAAGFNANYTLLEAAYSRIDFVCPTNS